MCKNEDGIIVMISKSNQLQWYGSVHDYISQFEKGYNYYIAAGITVCLKDLGEYLEVYNKLRTAIGIDIILILAQLKQLENKALSLIEDSFIKKRKRSKDIMLKY